MMRIPRIAHFLPHYPGREGTTAYCRGLCEAVNRRWPGAAPIVTLRDDGRPGGPADELIRYPHARRGGFSLPPDLLGDLGTNPTHIDGFVLHGTFNPPMAAFGRQLRKRGIPYVFVPHDPYVPGLMTHHRWRKALYWRLFEKPLIEGAVAVQLLDASHEAPLRARGCRVPVFSVPNGCDPSMLDLLDGSERVPGVSHPVRIQYLGRMDRNHKGLDLLLEAFARYLALPGAERGIELVLAGNDWTDRGWLEAYAGRLGIAERVRFAGPRKEPSIRVHAEADVVVLPSRFDGFGLTVVEAMLAARPVIVSSGAGVAGHVGKAGGGWVADPSAESLCSALAMAVERRSQWPEFGKMNRDYVTTHLTWDRVAELTMDAYGRYFR